MYLVKFSNLFLFWLACAAPCAHAQSLYKYQDENGVWVYTDRQPDGAQDYQETELESTLEKAEVRLYQLTADSGWVLAAENTYFGPVQIAYELVTMNNLSADTPRQGMYVLPARSESALVTITRGDLTQPSSFEYQFEYIPGDPAASHQPQMPYRLPFARRVTFPFPRRIPRPSLTAIRPASMLLIL